MSKLDCLIVGYNNIGFNKYRSLMQMTDPESMPSRKLNLRSLKIDNRYYNALEVIKLLASERRAKYQPAKDYFNYESMLSAELVLLYTFLKSKGISVDYVNSFKLEKELLIEKLLSHEIETIVLTSDDYTIAFPSKEAVEMIRKYNTRAKIILSGSFIYKQFLHPDLSSLKSLLGFIGADYYVNSNHEQQPILDIINSVKEKGSAYGVDNLYYLKDKELSNTPQNSRNIELKDYSIRWSDFANVGKYATIRTAISCPFTCAFCNYPSSRGDYFNVDLDYIERELNNLTAHPDVESVVFDDLSFNVPPKRFKSILKMMIKNKYRFKWNSYYYCHYTDREMLELMKESGCEGVLMGLESANQSILKNMNKKTSVEEYHKAAELFKEFEIPFLASFVVGYPGETEETFQDTVNFIRRHKLDFYHLWLWYYSDFTPVHHLKDKFNIKGKGYKWEHSSMNCHEASRLIDEAILSLGEADYAPFVFKDLVFLFHQGFDLQRAKSFTQAFNTAVRKSIVTGEEKNITPEDLERIRLTLPPELLHYEPSTITL